MTKTNYPHFICTGIKGTERTKIMAIFSQIGCADFSPFAFTVFTVFQRQKIIYTLKHYINRRVFSGTDVLYAENRNNQQFFICYIPYRGSCKILDFRNIKQSVIGIDADCFRSKSAASPFINHFSHALTSNSVNWLVVSSAGCSLGASFLGAGFFFSVFFLDFGAVFPV